MRHTQLGDSARAGSAKGPDCGGAPPGDPRRTAATRARSPGWPGWPGWPGSRLSTSTNSGRRCRRASRSRRSADSERVRPLVPERRATRACDLLVVGSALQGLALTRSGEVQAGMARLGSAVAAATAGDVVDLMWMGKVLCWPIAACHETQDVTRAEEWCRRARMGVLPESRAWQAGLEPGRWQDGRIGRAQVHLLGRVRHLIAAIRRKSRSASPPEANASRRRKGCARRAADAWRPQHRGVTHPIGHQSPARHG